MSFVTPAIISSNVLNSSPQTGFYRIHQVFAHLICTDGLIEIKLDLHLKVKSIRPGVICQTATKRLLKQNYNTNKIKTNLKKVIQVNLRNIRISLKRLFMPLNFKFKTHYSTPSLINLF